MGKKEDTKEKLKVVGTGIACVAFSVLAIAAETLCLTKLKNSRK